MRRFEADMGKATTTLAILFSLSGCVSPNITDWHGGERQAAIELINASKGSGMPPESALSPERERYRRASEDWTAGHLAHVANDYVVVDSVIPGVGTVRLSLPSDAVAFDGNTAVSIAQLPPGAPVRANFVGGKAATPELVSIEVISPEQLNGAPQK